MFIFVQKIVEKSQVLNQTDLELNMPRAIIFAAIQDRAMGRIYGQDAKMGLFEGLLAGGKTEKPLTTKKSDD